MGLEVLHSVLTQVSLRYVECTFLGEYMLLKVHLTSTDHVPGPSYKRGPPKGYIHAIEQRWHHVEAVLGAILSCQDARAQSLVADIRKDDLAREILNRVDVGPFVRLSLAHYLASC
jgi:hypothetical protein